MRNYLTYFKKICLSLMLAIILLTNALDLGPPAQSMALGMETTSHPLKPYGPGSIPLDQDAPLTVASQLRPEKEGSCPSGNFGTMCRIVREASGSVFLIKVLETPLPAPSIKKIHPETGTAQRMLDTPILIPTKMGTGFVIYHYPSSRRHTVRWSFGPASERGTGLP